MHLRFYNFSELIGYYERIFVLLLCGGDKEEKEMSEIPKYTYMQVQTAVKKVFPGREKEVNDILNCHPAETQKVWHQFDSETGVSRGRLAILKLSCGDIEKLKYFTNIANQDFRDVLLWAEYEDRGQTPFSEGGPKLIIEPYKELLED